MSYSLFFALHIAGAGATGVVALYSIYMLWNNVASALQMSAIVLGFLAGFQVLTGTILSVISLQISAASICSRVFVYLTVVALVEVMLFSRMKKISIPFPFEATLSPVAGSLALLGSALALGF